ncbi:MAG: LytTR family DNA-binding domain-containing protein [Balneolales bacterium]|nr:LytTR family DNA-binding domain-containing protein [Balneolales bacterium]
MIRVLLVDDEAPAHLVMQSYCEKAADVEVVGNCYDATSALAFLRTNPVDLMLLDMQMGDLTGFELLQTLDKPPLVVLVTAYSEFALESYEYGAVDYLVKPVRYQRFLKAMEKVRDRIQQDRSSAKISSEQMALPASQKAADDLFLTIKKEGVIEKLRINDIHYVESWGNYVKIHMEGKTCTERRTLSDLEEVLSSLGFVRIHKSCIVRISAIDALDGNRVRIKDCLLPVGATYKQKLRDLMKGV